MPEISILFIFFGTETGDIDGTAHIKQHRSKGIQHNNPPPPAWTITAALDMSKYVNTTNIHTLIRKLLNTNISGTIIQLGIQSLHNIHKPHLHRQFKTGGPQGSVLSPILFNIYTSDLPAPVQVMVYAYNITSTSTSAVHNSTMTALHTLNNAVEKGCSQMVPPARTMHSI